MLSGAPFLLPPDHCQPPRGAWVWGARLEALVADLKSDIGYGRILADKSQLKIHCRRGPGEKLVLPARYFRGIPYANVKMTSDMVGMEGLARCSSRRCDPALQLSSAACRIGRPDWALSVI